MLGKWHAFIDQPLHLKLKFMIRNLDEGMNVSFSMEPFPIAVNFDRVTIDHNHLQAYGIAQILSESEASLEMHFSGETCQGTLNLPPFGSLPFEGKQGAGGSQGEGIIEELAKYRRVGVLERTDAEIAEEVDKLLAKLSITEKVGQMSQCAASNFSFGGEVASDPPEKLVAEGRAGSILGAFDIRRVFELQKIAVEQSPHGIPLLFNADVIHGHQTIFPIPLAWSCSWDLDAIEEACAISAKEASASGITYNHGPMIDITRDSRWGRVMEGAGEDPYLGSLIAAAQVRGFQGDTLFSEETIIACLKHFIAYGAAEAGRDYNTVDISEGTLRNVYLPPFKAGIDAGAGSVMNSFNVYQGVPVAANKALVNGLLREELGFDGMMITDYGAIEEIVVHGNARDSKEAAKKAIDATMDIEMVTRAYDHLPQLIEEGIVSEAQLDAAVRRILTYKYKSGLMDDPFRYIRPEKEMEYHFHETHLEASRELARKSIVLLKNNGVLPLVKNAENIAVIGPFGSSRDLLGAWQFSRFGDDTVTLREGLEAKGVAADRLRFAEGCGVHREIEGGLEQAVSLANASDVVILALGESSDMSGEAASRTDITLPEVQQRLAEQIVSLGKPVILVLTNGRPLVLEWFEQHVDAILETWFLGSQAGHAIADVLFGDANPSGRLTMSFPAKAGQVPIYYNRFNTGRPVTDKNQHEKFISKYIDSPNEPLYPFGYGLSYSTFQYSELELDRNVMSIADVLTAKVTVTNIGDRAGQETVQLYIQGRYGSVVRPVMELKGFTKIQLQPGESKVVTFKVTEEELKYYTADESYRAEAGAFRVMIGSNAREVQVADFELI
jgi:beta-glucosidase